MESNVYVAGVGIHPFGQHDGSSLLDLSAVALREALGDADLTLAEIDEVFVGNAMANSGAIAGVAEELGIHRVPVTRIEQACASGSTALRLACEAVASGKRETVLAFGVDKMGRGLLQLDSEPTYEARLGLDLFPLLYGLKSNQYMESSGATKEDLAAVAVKARRLGALADHASTTEAADLEAVLASPMIADPVTRLQCCRNADGAAAAIVTSRPKGAAPVRVRGWIGGLGGDDPARPMTRGWDTREWIVEDLADRLYEDSGIGPDDIDIVQVNDAFSVAEPLYLEALGFAAIGEGYGLQRDGTTDIGGRLPTNTDGGLIGRGHCLGATGLAMLYELCNQLQGRCGTRQVAREAKVGLLQSHGYGGENLIILST